MCTEFFYSYILHSQAMLKVQICLVFLVLEAYSENMLKGFCRTQRICQKYLIIFGECTESLTQRLQQFLSGFIHIKSSPNTPKAFKRAWSIRLKNIKVFRENAKSILSYGENTPIDIKLSRAWQIFDKNQTNFRS